MEYQPKEELDNAEKIFNHSLFTDVNHNASAVDASLGQADRP